MSFIRRLLGIVVILTALTGIVLSAGCAYYSEPIIDDLAAQSTATIELARQNIQTTTSSLILARQTLDDVNTTLDTVAETALILSITVSETSPLIKDINDIATARVPDSLEAVEETLPNLAIVAGSIDDTLTALSNFGFRQNFFGLGTIDFDLGIDYDPETRFDDSVRDLEESLEGLPEQLREVEPQITTAQENLDEISTSIVLLADEIIIIKEDLEELPTFLGEYQDSLGEVDERLLELERDIKDQLETVKTAVLVLAFWFAFLQIAPLYMGWQMVTARTEEALIEHIQEEIATDQAIAQATAQEDAAAALDDKSPTEA